MCYAYLQPHVRSSVLEHSAIRCGVGVLTLHISFYMLSSCTTSTIVKFPELSSPNVAALYSVPDSLRVFAGVVYGS